MSTSPVSYELRENIALIQMDDGKANAMGPTMLQALSDAFDQAEKEAKAVVLAGRPGRFCAGFDLKVMMSGAQAARDLVAQGGELFMRLYEFPLPFVVACSGHAMAGGILLAATADYRIGIHGEFKIGLNEMSNGMPVPILAHELARDRLSPRALTQATLLARLYNPTEAVEVGWLDEVVDPEQLAGDAAKTAAQLAKLSSPAYSASKSTLRRRTIDYIRATMADNLAQFGLG